MSDNTKLLSVRNLDVAYLGVRDEENVTACADINLDLYRGEILGIAGESASGKSTLLTAITRLQQAPAVTVRGSVLFHSASSTEPIDLVRATERELREFRWSDISIVMQSAMACLNPVTRLYVQFSDVLRAHDRTLTKEAAKQRCAELLNLVGIPAQAMYKFAHELSGGMRQRALIALALACNPDLIVMDEPTTAVDVVMQRQILNQILKLQSQLGFAVIFVTHDLSLLLELADRIAIMYGGRIVEVGRAKQIATQPQHPYTRGLRDAFPSLTGELKELHGIPGSPPDLRNLPPGCAFEPRCSDRIPQCKTQRPELADNGISLTACYLHSAQESPKKVENHA